MEENRRLVHQAIGLYEREKPDAGEAACREASLRTALKRYKILRKKDRALYNMNIAATTLDLGIIYGMQGKFFKAVLTLRRAVRQRTKLAIKNPEAHGADLVRCYMALGRVYMSKRVDGFAVRCFSFASEINKRQTAIDYDIQTCAYMSMGKIYAKSKRSAPIALKCFEAALESAAKNDTSCGQHLINSARLLTLTGDAYKMMKQFAAAEQAYMESNAAYASMDSGDEFCIELAMNYICAADAQQKLNKPEEAARMLQSARHILEKADIKKDKHVKAPQSEIDRARRILKELK